MTKNKSLKISEELHKKLKVAAAKEGVSIIDLVTRIILKYLGMVCVVFLVSCGTTRYVKVDKPNMARFEHDQKIIEGMSRQEVLDYFGSPDQAYETTFGTKGAVVWRYYHKIFCGHMGNRCEVYFRNDSVVYTSNFRMEFNNTVAGGR